MTGALFDLPTAPVEPYPCTGTAHEHRWLRFGKTGEKDVAVVLVDAAGLVSVSEQLMDQLMREAGFLRADPDSIEINTMHRLAAAKSRLLAALPGRNPNR